MGVTTLARQSRFASCDSVELRWFVKENPDSRAARPDAQITAHAAGAGRAPPLRRFLMPKFQDSNSSYAAENQGREKFPIAQNQGACWLSANRP